MLDLSFRTRVDFVFVVVFALEEEGLEVVTAQFSGMEEAEEPDAAGREG